MVDTNDADALKSRLSALSPAQRRWLEQRLRASVAKVPVRKGPAEVVQLQKGSGELPVYFIYAGPEEISLAQMMGAGRSIFGIEMAWPLSWHEAAQNYNAAALPSMEELVAPFAAALSDHVGSRPCVLAGYSFAGVMAFEAAHKLQKLGGKVKMVILLDTRGRHTQLRDAFWDKLQHGWKITRKKAHEERSGNSIYLPLRRAWLMSRLVLIKGIKRIFRFERRPLSKLSAKTVFTDERGYPIALQTLERLYARAKKSYDFRVLDSYGVLFQVDQDEEYLGAYDETLGWNNLFAKGLEIISVTGDHHTMVWNESHRSTLAGKIIDVLERHSTGGGNT